MPDNGTENFARFCLLVLSDLSLQTPLREIEKKSDLIARVVKLGELHGFVFTSENVEQAMLENTQGWIERWI